MQDASGISQPVMLVSSPSQLKAFAHPTRLQLLELLIHQAMTTKQLGDSLGMSAARAHYHLKFIERAGLVRQVYRREKAGVIEKYYRAVSRKYIVSRSVGSFGEPGAVILESLSGTMLRGAVAADSGSEVGLVFGATERVRLSRDQLQELLRVASLLQSVQEEFAGLDSPAVAAQPQEHFELTLALYAARPELECLVDEVAAGRDVEEAQDEES